MKKLFIDVLLPAAGAAIGATVAHFVGNKNTAEETETTAGQEAAAPEPEKAPDPAPVKEK